MTEATVSEQLRGFVDDLERSLTFRVGRRFECDEILLCGVGGSAVSGDFAADCCMAESRVPIRLMKYPDLPSWVDDRTLAVVSSYSGNTAETLEMYRQAKDRGCPVVAITSGGVLADRASEAGDLVVALPKGMQPRHAIGYMIGYTLAVIHAAGGPDLSSRIAAFIPSIKSYRDEISLGTGCLARRIASSFMGHVPVICSGPGMKSVSFRWKTQVNENAKFVAFCEHTPEFRRHGMSAWSGTDRSDFVILFLIGHDSGDLESMMEAVKAGPSQVIGVRLGGGSDLEDMFRAIILGDYVSMYMAQMRGIDPAEVRPVMQMKAKLKTVLDS